MNEIQLIYRNNNKQVYNKTEFNSNVGSEGYGEIGYDSVEEIIKTFKDYFNENTVFYDLGSGLGKLVIHIGLRCNVKKSCGIEYSLERYNYSVGINPGGNIYFINDNFVNIDISDATVIYTDNTLFPTSIDELIYSKIPKGCLVLSRKMFKSGRLNDEMVKINVNSPTEYGTNNLYVLIKK